MNDASKRTKERKSYGVGELKNWGRLAFQRIPAKPAMSINSFTAFEKGFFGREERECIDIPEFVICIAPKSQNTIVILQLLRNKD
jgi:hypothetical protein